jgi:hypothetical protein
MKNKSNVKYEVTHIFKSVVIPNKEIEKLLNDGWECVASYFTPGGYAHMYFKRETK